MSLMNVVKHYLNGSKNQSKSVVQVNIKAKMKSEEDKEERRSKWREYKRRYRENKRKKNALTKSSSSPKVPISVKSSNISLVKKEESKEIPNPIEKILKKDQKIETLQLKWKISKSQGNERKRNDHLNPSSMIVEGNAIFFVEDVHKNHSIFIEESDHYENDQDFEKNHFNNYVQQSNQGLHQGNHECGKTFNLTETDNGEVELFEIKSEPLEFLEV